VKLLQIWKFAGRGRDADSLDQAIALAQQYGYDGLLVKALDGTQWMSAFDPSTDAIGSADQVAAQRDRCHAANIKYYAWTNPLHDVDLDVQAQRTAAAARMSDGLFLDVEPYSGRPPFWGALRPTGLADSFMRRVRDLAPDAWFALQPDPRAARLREIRPEEWFPYVDAFAGQHYWTDFSPAPETWGTRARLELTYAAELGRAWNKPVLPTLPGISNPSAFPTNMLRAFPGFVVYRLGSTSPETLELLGSVPVEAQQTPQGPPPDLDPFDSLVNALAYVCDTLGDQLERTAAELNEHGDRVRAILSEMQRVRNQFVGERPIVVSSTEPQPVSPEPTPPEAEPQGPTYNAGVPTLIQPNDWACSVCSLTMALQSVGIQTDWSTLRGQLGDAVTTQWGLMDSRGSALVQVIEQHGLTAGVIPNNQEGGATWEDVLARAGHTPVVMGGRGWNHWTFVRGVENGNLLLGNPAPRWMGVGQTMDRQEFNNLGAWTMVWIEVGGAAPEEDPVKIAQLENQLADAQAQVRALEGQVDGLSQGLAHVVDVLVPQIADPASSDDQRQELLRTAEAIRVQQMGARPDAVHA
jgi:hypothetical protein